MNEAAPVKLKRVAKGKRPQYFADPATDKLLVMVLELTQELSVTRDRLDTVERLLDDAGVLSMTAVDSWLPSRAAAEARGARRAEMLSRIFRASQQELEAVVGPGASGPASFSAEALT
jgi:hypothetical protein